MANHSFGYQPIPNDQTSGFGVLLNFTVELSTGLNATRNISGPPPVNFVAIICISFLFCIIGVIGITGNACVIFIILSDAKMRRSVTNLFIMNLAVSDLLIMLWGVPDIVQFMINRGWLLGEPMCKLERYVLVVSLYSSVITLVAVCVERYIAIVHPLHAHVLCCRRRMLAVILSMWPTVILLALPVAFYNKLISPPSADITFCSLHFPHLYYLVTFKYAEFFLFYLVPMLVQIVCYAIIGKHLFAGTAELHRNHKTCNGPGDGSSGKAKTSEAIKQRKGVVKMLIASVIIYFVSYSPHQILLVYNTFSHAPFHQTWVWVVFVTAMGYINSAASPLLYCVFSQTFRLKFRRLFFRCCHIRALADRSTAQHDFQSGTSMHKCQMTMVTKAAGGASPPVVDKESHHLLKMSWKKQNSTKHGTFV